MLSVKCMMEALFVGSGPRLPRSAKQTWTPRSAQAQISPISENGGTLNNAMLQTVLSVPKGETLDSAALDKGFG